MKTLHVTSHAQRGASTNEVDILIAARDVDHRICCLGEDGPASLAWRAVGRSVDVLNWRHWLDPRPLWTLARSIRDFQPDVIQAWGLTSLCAVYLAARKTDAIIAVRKPIPVERSLSGFDRWLLRRADNVLARSHAEARRCSAAGVVAKKLHVVPPGVKAIQVTQLNNKPLILCLGALLPHKGFYDAIWAYDILHHAHSTVELAIVGEGPDRRRLEQLALTMGRPERIHLPGKTSDVDSWLARATVVWIPSLTNGGTRTALVAMAAGRVVIAYQRPSLAEFIVDGETGFLVEPGNKMDLASQTLQLLQSPTILRRLGDAGRKRAQDFYSPEEFLDAWTGAFAPQISGPAADPPAATFPGKYVNVGRH